MKARIVFLLMMVASILGACVQSNGGATPSNKDKQFASKVQGSWQGPCMSSIGNEHMISGMTVATFSSSELILTGSNFASKDCSGMETGKLTGSFAYEISTPSEIDPNIFNLNVSLRSLSQVFYDQDEANAANSMSYCGFTDWIVGVEKDITGLACTSGMGSPGKTIFSIIKVFDNQIQLGESDSSHDGSTPELRHVLLSEETFKNID